MKHEKPIAKVSPTEGTGPASSEGRDDLDAAAEFVARESYTDCAGKIRHFDMNIHELPGHGFVGRATEVTRKPHGGYEFGSLAEGMSLALARLRLAVQAGIAQRYLIRHEGHLEMPLQRLRGRIGADGLLVDGDLLDWEALRTLLTAHEGFEFELSIPFEPDRWFRS